MIEVSGAVDLHESVRMRGREREEGARGREEAEVEKRGYRERVLLAVDPSSGSKRREGVVGAMCPSSRGGSLRSSLT
jgi:hypothetical protein